MPRQTFRPPWVLEALGRQRWLGWAPAARGSQQEAGAVPCSSLHCAKWLWARPSGHFCLPVGFTKASPARRVTGSVCNFPPALSKELGKISPASISPRVKRDPERPAPGPARRCQPRALPRSAVPEQSPGGHGAAAAPGTRVSRGPGAERCPLPSWPAPTSRTCGPAAGPSLRPCPGLLWAARRAPHRTGAPAPGASSGAGTGSAERAEWQAARR